MTTFGTRFRSQPRLAASLMLTQRALGIVTIVGAAFQLSACDGTGPRIYSAMHYDATANCLGEYQPLGQVEADELPATCAPVCLTEGSTLYVSSVCPPYPDAATLVTPVDSIACAEALALNGQPNGACPTDP